MQIPAFSTMVSEVQADELLREISACNGQALNASAIGRRLGLSCHSVLHCIASLENAGIIRVLPSLSCRRPHVLLRDCRLLQDFGGSRLAILRSCLTERITKSYRAGHSSVRFFQWEAGRVKRIDLVAATSKETVGFQVTECPALRNRNWAPLRLAIKGGIVNRGFLVHCGTGAFVTARVVIVLPVQEFLGHLDRWLACGSFREAQELLRVTSPQPQLPGHDQDQPACRHLLPDSAWFSKLSLF